MLLNGLQIALMAVSQLQDFSSCTCRLGVYESPTHTPRAGSRLGHAR
jgi:tRNA(Phe) wybutosine-synthesizing methylase Tyw3